MATDTYGLNKAARLQAQRDAQAKADTPEPLDPPFPLSRNRLIQRSLA